MKPKIENIGGQLCVQINKNEYISLEDYYKRKNLNNKQNRINNNINNNSNNIYLNNYNSIDLANINYENNNNSNDVVNINYDNNNNLIYFENINSYNTVLNNYNSKNILGNQNNNDFDYKSITSIKNNNQTRNEYKNNPDPFNYIFNNWDKFTNTRIIRMNKRNEIRNKTNPNNYNYWNFPQSNEKNYMNENNINNNNYENNINYEYNTDILNPTNNNTYNKSSNNIDWNNYFNTSTTSTDNQNQNIQVDYFSSPKNAKVRKITSNTNQLITNVKSYPSNEDINSQFTNLTPENENLSLDQKINENIEHYFKEQNMTNPLNIQNITKTGQIIFQEEQKEEKKYPKITDIRKNQQNSNIPENQNIANIPEKENLTNIPEITNITNIPENQNISNINNNNKNTIENTNQITYDSTPVESIPEKKDDENKPKPPMPVPQNSFYYFHLKGLDNIGSTCYMNSVLQCLLHVSELIYYFLNEYPKDCNLLKEKNNDVSTQGNISKVFYELIKSVYPENKDNTNNLDSVSPENFQKIIGNYNPQFRNLEANDSKDLILYLMQSMHSELNYSSKNKAIEGVPNQYDRGNTFHYFIHSYDVKNFSIISKIFYGTYENITKCNVCQKHLYNFQKFEFISFGMIDYVGKEFSIYNGFKDNEKIQKLTGDNQFYCNVCKKLNDAETYSKIIVPPYKLLINIDYGKNKKFIPNKMNFDEEIDISNYVNFDFGTRIKYRLIGACTHFGESGLAGHYVAYCKNLENGKWYLFNDFICEESDKSNIYSGNPYLLLYERIL